MKRVIAAAFLVVLAIAICLFGRFTTAKHTEEIQTAMAQIDAKLTAGDFAGALEDSRSIQQEWEHIHGQLCLFLQHEHLEPLENVFAVLPYYIEQKEVSLARSECLLVQNVTEHICKTERLTPENLL